MSRWMRWLKDSWRYVRTCVAGASRRGRCRPALFLEPLETRELLSVTPTIEWDGGAGTLDALDAANWTEDRLPTAADDVLIQGIAPAASVSLTGTLAVHSLWSAAGLDIGGALSVASDSEVLGAVTVGSSGSLGVLGGTLLLGGGGSAAGAVSVASGATLSLADDFGLLAGSMYGMVLAGTLDVGAGQQFSVSQSTLVLETGAAITGAGQTVLSSGTLQVAGAATATQVTMASSSQLTGSGDLTVSGTFDWAGGTLGGGGTTTIAAGGVLRLAAGDPAGRYLDDRTVANAGTILWLGGGLQTQYGTGGVVRNLAGGVIDVTGADSVTAPVAFDNQGTFRIDVGPGAFDLGDAYLNNSGTVSVETGTLRVAYGAASGAFAVSDGATLRFGTGTSSYYDNDSYNGNSYYGRYILGAGSALTGAGDVVFAGSAVSVNGAYDVQGRTDILAGSAVAFNSAVTTQDGSLAGDPYNTALGGTGTFTIGGTFDWASGAMAGSGTTAVAAGGTLRLAVPTPSTPERRLSGRTLANAGTVDWLGGAIRSEGYASTIRNLAGGVIDVTGAGSVAADSTAPLTFDNEGTLQITVGAGAFDLGDAVLDNGGTVSVETGTLDVAYGTASGSFAVGDGATLRFGTGSHNGSSAGGPDRYGYYTLDADSAVSGAGLVVFAASAVSVNGAYDVQGRTDILAGSAVAFNSTASTQDGSLSGDPYNTVLGGTGTLTIGGTFDWASGAMADAGTTAVGPGGHLVVAEDPSAPERRLVGGRTVANAGTVDWLGGAIHSDGTGGTIRNLAGGLIEVTGEGSILTPSSSSDPTPVTVDNQGTLRVAVAAGAFDLGDAVLDNGGTVAVETGTLDVAYGTASGEFAVSDGATLRFGTGTRYYPDDSPSTNSYYGRYTLGADSAVSGAGLVVFDASAVSVNGAYDVQGRTDILAGSAVAFNGTASTRDGSLAGNPSNTVLRGTGTLTIGGTFDWTSGTMAGTGTTAVAQGGILRLAAPAPSSDERHLNGRTLGISGTMDWLGGAVHSDGVGGTIRTLAGGLIDVTGAGSVVSPTYDSSATPVTFDNQGTFRVAIGAGTFDLGDATFNNDGDVGVETGTLRVAYGTAESGTFAVSDGSTLRFATGSISYYDENAYYNGGSFQNGYHYGRYTLGVNSSLTGAGRVVFDRTAVTVDGAYDVTGRTDILSESAVAFNGIASTHDGSLAGDYHNTFLRGSGTLTIGGTFDWSSGMMAGTGTTAVAQGGVLRLVGGTPADHYLNGRTVANAGTVAWPGGTITAEGNPSTIRNLPGGVVDVTGAGSIVSPSSDPSANPLTFDNQGTLRVTVGAGIVDLGNAVLDNGGTVEVQAGTLRVGRGTSGGAITIAAGAVFLVGANEAGGFTLAGGAAVEGAGVFRIGGRVIVGSGNSTARMVELAPGGILDGVGTLGVTGNFVWTGGTQSGSGSTRIESGAVLRLDGDGERIVDGRSLDVAGQVSWTGQGAITRRFGDRTETFDNARVPQGGSSLPPGIAPFSAAADAGKLYRAAHPGAFGIGADKDTIYRILASRTTEQIQAIRQAYSAAYSNRNLDDDLNAELDSTERKRLAALLAQNRTGADAAALYYAMYPGWTGLGTDKATVYRILEKGNIPALAAAYDELFGPGRSLKADLEWEFSGWEEVRVVALYDAGVPGNDAAALRARGDAAGLRVALLGGWWVDTAAIEAILLGKTQAQMGAIRDAYRTLDPNEGPRNLGEDLSARVGPAYANLVAGLMNGEPLQALAARLRRAFDQDNDGSITDWDGTDEDAIWRTLDGLRSDQRLRLAQVYKAQYNSELRDGFDAELSDSDWFWGYQRAKTFALYEHGGLSLAQKLYYAVQGWGTDEQSLHAALAELGQLPLESATGPSVQQVDAEYRQLSGGTSLYNSLWWQLGGRDWQRARQAMQGRPDGIVGEANRLLELKGYERDGSQNWLNYANNAFQLFNSTGSNLDNAAAAVVTARDVYQANSSDANRDSLRSAMDRLAEDLETFEGARDALSATFATTLTTAAALGIGFFTAGTTTPLAVLVFYSGGIGAATQVVPRLVISGQTYDLTDLPSDLLSGAVATGTAPFAFYKLAEGSTPVRNVFLGAMEGVANGGSLGFLTGALDAAVRLETWDEGFEIGILSVAQNGVASAAIGAPLGGLVGGLVRAIKGLPPGPYFGSGSDLYVPGARQVTTNPMYQALKEQLAKDYDELFGPLYGQNSNFIHETDWKAVEPGLGTKQVGNQLRYEVRLTPDVPDYVALEELYHLQQAVRKFGPNGAQQLDEFLGRVESARKAIKDKTPEQIAAWAQESAANRQALDDLLEYLDMEKEAKNWVLSNLSLRAQYAPDVWAAIEQKVLQSLDTYEVHRPKVEDAIALLQQGP